ncbi:hypothetical protein OG887_19210 [Streptomyces sp. NBC_00053]|uniref:hypothetical protein n=1 Tax=unclassified Streptomyces TaxID=2593676 RepID=UPI000F5BE6EA|nr:MULTISPECIES: hypothetical protein [unclassified Streptomyces]WSG51753.1 hypothetical protein OHA38_19210 [Streptomyces sp. NBC_01732]WSX02409.1 hypothetical protein OG355_19345 [Streptomyces sp. NBC_00987]MCX5501492.1 hypothetical protein [Streptomyces sp. NBC_00052]MCX5549973.1 hypothetical protein [Streptomyces sp. NBC_00051]MEE1813326.1 hypothetical protein [Streptomyces sp. BE133]
MEEHRTDRNHRRQSTASQTNNEASGGTFHGPVIMGGQVQFGQNQIPVRNGTRLGAHEQMYSCGEWVDLAYDPVPDAGTGDFYDDLRAAEFDPWLAADGFADKVDSRYAHDRHVPLNLVVYERHSRVPRFVIVLTGNTYGSILTTYAASLPDLMDLLAKWTPTINLLAQIDGLAKDQRDSTGADEHSAAALSLPASSHLSRIVSPNGPRTPRRAD